MRIRILAVTAALALLAATAAWGSFGGGGSKDDPPASSSAPEAGNPPATPRQQAEQLYNDGYDEAQKAKADLASGKAKNAEKRFKKALDRAERATELDSTYHEAWNLAGYSARKLGNYDKALAAYDHCLRLKPTYAPAREYLGEAYLEMGKPAEAREQLAWLEKLNAAEDAKTLRTAIETYEKTHPSAAPAGAAPADSASKGL
jgi:tetratricopeptide (TPR) repeat protein